VELLDASELFIEGEYLDYKFTWDFPDGEAPRLSFRTIDFRFLDGEGNNLMMSVEVILLTGESTTLEKKA